LVWLVQGSTSTYGRYLMDNYSNLNSFVAIEEDVIIVSISFNRLINIWLVAILYTKIYYIQALSHYIVYNSLHLTH
jgi:hypothetical protein